MGFFYYYSRESIFKLGIVTLSVCELSSYPISIFTTWCQFSLHACISVESRLNSCVPNSWFLVGMLTYFTMLYSLEVWCVFYSCINFFLKGQWDMSRVTLRIVYIQLELTLSPSCQLRKVIVILVCSLCTWHHTQQLTTFQKRSSSSDSRPAFILVVLLCFYTTSATL